VIIDPVLRNTNPSAPLAALLTLTTDEPAEISLLAEDGERSWSIQPGSEFATDHSLMVLGLRSGRAHSIKVVAQDAARNRSESDALVIETPPLPEGILQPKLTVRKPAQMEPGVILYNSQARLANGDDYTSLVIVDDEGEVVWFYSAGDGPHDSRRLSNGNILYSDGREGRLVEIDMLGNIVNQWHARTRRNVPPGSIRVETDSFHHEVLELPSGNFLTLSSEVRVIEDYPASAIDPDEPPREANVAGDVLVEFSRDGAVLREWKIMDLLDTRRVGHGSINNSDTYESVYAGVVQPPIYNWSHSNALAYDPRGETVVISVRNQDALIKLDLETGKLVWILGTADNWREPWSSLLLEPDGELKWPFHQHGVSLTEKGTILLFDNGDFQASAYQVPVRWEDRYSRAVEYAIDEEAMRVSQVWVYDGSDGEAFFSHYLSDADELPQTGNILITDGARQTDARGRPSRAEGSKFWARIVEVTRTQPAKKVFELVLEGAPPFRMTIYRAQHLPGLYPGEPAARGR
jgi:arylsulfate sulfotransferase